MAGSSACTRPPGGIGALDTPDVRELRDVVAARARVCLTVDLAGLDYQHYLTAAAVLSVAARKMQDQGSILTVCNPLAALPRSCWQPSRSRSPASSWTHPAPAASRSARWPRIRGQPPGKDTSLPRRTAAVHDQTAGCPVRWHGRQAVVTLPEQIDVVHSGPIRGPAGHHQPRRASPLVVDMTATVSCHHSRAAAVARAFQRAAASGTGLRLAVTAGMVRRVLSLSGLDRLVSIYPSLEAATAARAPAAMPPLTLVDSPAGTGTNGRRASSPLDAPSGRGASASGRARPAGPPPGADTAITPAVIWEMAESFHDGVALAGGGGAIMLASRRLEDMFGYGHAVPTGSTIERLVLRRAKTLRVSDLLLYAQRPC